MENNGAAKAEGMQPSTACASCGMENQETAKFCAQCGVSMAALPLPDDEEEGPASSEDPAALAVRAAAVTIETPKALPPESSLASILGASSDSPLAIKTAAIKMRHTLDRFKATAAGVTGKASTDEQIGQLLAMPARLAKGEQAVKDQRAALAKAEHTERLDLCRRGVATGAAEMTAGKVYLPQANEAGKRTGTTLAPVFAEMRIGTLRGMVEGLEANATPRNPFVENKAAAKDASDAARAELSGGPPRLTDGKPTATQIATATKDPVVKRIHASMNGTKSIEAIAEQYLIEAAKAHTMSAGA